MDAIDRFIIRCMISIWLTEIVKSYFSEEKKIERLRQDLIKQSKTLNSGSPVKVPVSSKSNRVLPRSTLYIRGGELTNLQKLKSLRKVFKGIQTLIRELYKITEKSSNRNNLILKLLRWNLFVILKLWRMTIEVPTIHVTHFYTDKTEAILEPLSWISGPALSWAGVTTTLSLEIFLTILAVKSGIEQFIHNGVYGDYQEERLNDIHEDIRKLRFSNDKMSHVLNKVEHIVSNERKLKPPQWILEPETERMAERLGITKDIMKEYNMESNINEIIKESSLGEMVKEGPFYKRLYERMKEKAIKKRYKTLQDLLNKIREGANLVDEYEEYIPPIEVLPPIKVK